MPYEVRELPAASQLSKDRKKPLGSSGNATGLVRFYLFLKMLRSAGIRSSGPRANRQGKFRHSVPKVFLNHLGIALFITFVFVASRRVGRYGGSL